MKDDSTPATKADLKRLEAALSDAMGQQVGNLRTEMREMAKGLHAAIDQVLTVLVNVNNRLTDSVENHERRITRLEARIGIDA